MSRSARLTGSLGLTLLAWAPLAAQKTPNLSGTWVMALDKSSFGPMPGPQSRTDVVEHKGTSITVKRTVVGPNGETTATIERTKNALTSATLAKPGLRSASVVTPMLATIHTAPVSAI